MASPNHLTAYNRIADNIEGLTPADYSIILQSIADNLALPSEGGATTDYSIILQSIASALAGDSGPAADGILARIAGISEVLGGLNLDTNLKLNEMLLQQIALNEKMVTLIECVCSIQHSTKQMNKAVQYVSRDGPSLGIDRPDTEFPSPFDEDPPSYWEIDDSPPVIISAESIPDGGVIPIGGLEGENSLSAYKAHKCDKAYLLYELLLDWCAWLSGAEITTMLATGATASTIYAYLYQIISLSEWMAWDYSTPSSSIKPHPTLIRVSPLKTTLSRFFGAAIAEKLYAFIIPSATFTANFVLFSIAAIMIALAALGAAVAWYVSYLHQALLDYRSILLCELYEAKSPAEAAARFKEKLDSLTTDYYEQNGVDTTALEPWRLVVDFVFTEDALSLLFVDVDGVDMASISGIGSCGQCEGCIGAEWLAVSGGQAHYVEGVNRDGVTHTPETIVIDTVTLPAGTGDVCLADIKIRVRPADATRTCGGDWGVRDNMPIKSWSQAMGQLTIEWWLVKEGGARFDHARCHSIEEVFVEIL